MLNRWVRMCGTARGGLGLGEWGEGWGGVALHGHHVRPQATSTKDHVVKKMVYLYITTYASSNPELSLLAINTLQKDCRDEDPMTRGLALRSFTSLRLEGVVEYLPKVITDGLRDQSPYVRKTAVMACVKLHHLSPESVTDGDFINTLYNMLRDRDPQECPCTSAIVYSGMPVHILLQPLINLVHSSSP